MQTMQTIMHPPVETTVPSKQPLRERWLPVISEREQLRLYLLNKQGKDDRLSGTAYRAH